MLRSLGETVSRQIADNQPTAEIEKIKFPGAAGVFDVRARFLVPVSALISDDLPTLERPAKQISNRPFAGNCRGSTAPSKKSQRAEKSLRPASISRSVKGADMSNYLAPPPSTETPI